MTLIESIEHVLPQTQCRQCGYDGCKPYATALIHDNALINLCPPGGIEGITSLAKLLGKPVIAFESDAYLAQKKLAYIVEEDCIGCTHCIRACPVDAIVGAAKKMHSVVAEACTGCALCLAPCPVDCIVMRPLTTEEQLKEDTLSKQDKLQYAQIYRSRYELKQLRKNKKKIQSNRTVNTRVKTRENAQAISQSISKKDLLASILTKAQSNQPNETQSKFYQQQSQSKVQYDLEKAAERKLRQQYQCPRKSDN